MYRCWDYFVKYCFKFKKTYFLCDAQNLSVIFYPLIILVKKVNNQNYASIYWAFLFKVTLDDNQTARHLEISLYDKSSGSTISLNEKVQEESEYVRVFIFFNSKAFT